MHCLQYNEIENMGIFQTQMCLVLKFYNHCFAFLFSKPIIKINKFIFQVTFDPFSLRHTANWRTVMEGFHREVLAIENEAKHFIDDSFKTLRSAEGAFDMLLNFRHIRSRETINSQMMKKFNDILLQFGKEVTELCTRNYLIHNV